MFSLLFILALLIITSIEYTHILPNKRIKNYFQKGGARPEKALEKAKFCVVEYLHKKISEMNFPNPFYLILIPINPCGIISFHFHFMWFFWEGGSQGYQKYEYFQNICLLAFLKMYSKWTYTYCYSNNGLLYYFFSQNISTVCQITPCPFLFSELL